MGSTDVRVVALAALTAAAGLAATGLQAAAWTPPIGIPAPPFGVVETGPPAPQPWTNPVAGFYWVEPTHPSATDSSNANGTPSRPRLTIPQTVPAGAVIELRGTYTRNQTSPNGLHCAGTAAQPAFIRGAPGVMITGSWEVDGSYCILEKLTFAGQGGMFLSPGHHLALRDSDVSGTPDAGGWWVQTFSASDITDVVILRTRIHDNGDWQATFDQDVHGTGIYRSSSATGSIARVWILDNEYFHNSGDGVQINGNQDQGRTRLHHIYLGRNISHHNKQTGLWSKQASDVVFSQNTVYGHRPSDSSFGAGLGYQYGPERVWFLFNHVHDCEVGIAAASDLGDGGDGLESYFIGNVIHNIHSGTFRSDTAWDSGAFMLSGGTSRYLVNNTIYDVDAGINSPGPGMLRMTNNVIANMTQAQGAHVFLELGSTAAASLMDHNLFMGTVRIKWGTNTAVGLGGVSCVGCLNANPALVNPAAEDFHLGPTSPAINAGVLHTAYARFQTLYGLDIARDADGTARPQGPAWDLGAYEAPGARHYVLWSADNLAQVWRVDGTQVTAISGFGGPGTGWTATSYTRNSDGTAQLLWTTNNLAHLWTLNADGSFGGARGFSGPGVGWTATSYFKNTDGSYVLLWTKNNLAHVWTIRADHTFGDAFGLGGPGNGWVANSYSRAADGSHRVVWSTNGLAHVWTILANFGWGGATGLSGPTTTSTAMGYHLNADGSWHIGWSAANQGQIWTIGPTGAWGGSFVLTGPSAAYHLESDCR